MDIQKEREAFEKLPAVAELIKTNNVWWSEVHGDYFGSDHELDCWIDGAWAVWQAKSQAVPEGFVLVPKVISDEWMEVFVEQKLSEYCKSYEGLPFSVKDDELPDLREGFRLPIRNAHKRLMLVLEAQEQSHE